MAATCFGPFGPSGSIRQNLAKVIVFVEIISKNTSLKLLLCSGNMCCVYWVLCTAQNSVHTLQTEVHIATAQQQLYRCILTNNFYKDCNFSKVPSYAP
jgi:hypothetical protein